MFLTTHDGSFQSNANGHQQNALEQPRRLGWSARTSNGGSASIRGQCKVAVCPGHRLHFNYISLRVDHRRQSQPRRRFLACRARTGVDRVRPQKEMSRGAFTFPPARIGPFGATTDWSRSWRGSAGKDSADSRHQGTPPGTPPATPSPGAMAAAKSFPSGFFAKTSDLTRYDPWRDPTSPTPTTLWVFGATRP